MAKKCPVCGISSKEEEMVKIGTRYYHIGECEKIKRKELKEGEDYKTLVQYLCNICKVDEPNPVWLSTIKRYREDSHYTSAGIMLTLKHYYEYLGNPIKQETKILGIVPYYYQDAKEKYIADLQRRKMTRQFFADGNDMVTHEKIVVKVKKEDTSLKQRRMIDLSIFEEGEEDDVTN